MANFITRDEAIDLFRQMFEEKMALLDEQSDSSDSDDSDDSDDSETDDSETDDSETDDDSAAWVTAPTLEELTRMVACDNCGKKLLFVNLKTHKKTKTCKKA